MVCLRPGHAIAANSRSCVTGTGDGGGGAINHSQGAAGPIVSVATA